jgi:hypothetical protein
VPSPDLLHLVAFWDEGAPTETLEQWHLQLKPGYLKLESSMHTRAGLPARYFSSINGGNICPGKLRGTNFIVTRGVVAVVRERGTVAGAH